MPEEGSFGSSLWSVLSSKLGADVIRSGISLPSWMYEPLSILQRQAEMIEHASTLDDAAKCEDSIDQLAFVAGFAVSAYSATQRYRPSFNPMLGETFEYIDETNNVRFFAEQVSHHPPVSAFHSDRPNEWIFWQNSSPTTKFLGNSLDLDTHGNSHLYFHGTQNHFYYTNPCTRVHNIILGSMWIEHYGLLDIKSTNGSLSCIVNFKQSGYFFQGTQYQIDGFIFHKDGKKLVKLEGRWDTQLTGTWLVDTPTTKAGETKLLWKNVTKPIIQPEYNFTPFTASLNDCNEIMEKVLLPTDSRRRLDRLFLQNGDTDNATQWKKVMEETQRTDRKNRNTDQWDPVWFKPSDQDADKNLWVYVGGHWEQREERLKLVTEGKECGDAFPKAICGLACDFLNYPVRPSLLHDSHAFKKD
uniref:Oxysterol-binding protein n=1 Tax=Arcella intermedia TaxID=1963864 RepID=A0A6B2L4H8_9EUKA